MALAHVLSTPGSVDPDLPTHVKKAWSDLQVGRAAMNLAEMMGAAGTSDPSRIAYLHPNDSASLGKGTLVPVGWDGFPETMTDLFQDRDAVAAETTGYEDVPIIGRDRGVSGQTLLGEPIELGVRHRQDEYLEWFSAHRDGVLTSVTFVAEAWDYFEFLMANEEEKRVVDMYQRCTDSPLLTVDDLRPSTELFVASATGRLPVIGRNGFNWRNQFNIQRGIVHLSHRANNLNAEVALAVTSAVPRLDGAGQIVRDEGARNFAKKLMCCTGGGEPNRSSDPLIAAGAYRAVTSETNPSKFTLADPIGLYIRSYAHSALHLPKGGGPAPFDWWSPERGTRPVDPDKPDDSRILRLKVEVPESEGFVLGDMTVNGRPLRHGAQLAKLIKMHLIVEAWPRTVDVASVGCAGGCCTDGVTLEGYKGSTPACSNGFEDAFPNLAAVSHGPRPQLLATRRTQ